MKMPFGKYKNRELRDVPLDYLGWLFAQKNIYEPLRSEIADELYEREHIEAIEKNFAKIKQSFEQPKEVCPSCHAEGSPEDFRDCSGVLIGGCPLRLCPKCGCEWMIAGDESPIQIIKQGEKQ